MKPRRVYHTQGIVLKRRSYGEADRILTVFSKDYGKLSVLAKGIRRITSKRAPHVEVFTHVHLYLHQGKTWDIVSDAITIERFSPIRHTLHRISLAYYACDLIDALLPERQEHQDIYEHLLAALGALASVQEGGLVRVHHEFSVTILTSLGYLSRANKLSDHHIQPFIERIVERPMRSYAFLTRQRFPV